MNATAHDGVAAEIVPNEAAGYAPRGSDQLEDAPYVDWSVKTGNGSLYTTVDDLHKFLRGLLMGKLLKRRSLDLGWREHAGTEYGWFSRQRNGRKVISTNGMSPGFAAALDYYPSEDLLVIVLGNLYLAAAQSPVATDLALIALGEPPKGQTFVPKKVAAAELKQYVGAYRFGEDFFRGPILIHVLLDGETLVLDWGNNFRTPLTPLGNGEFLLRRFWSRIIFRPGELIYRDERDYVAKRQ
jgi:CubicO group peptidase (beta-lactamase class C family)